jgi:DNA-binding transcriptional LysR family regulator
MLDLYKLEIFARVVEAGSFSGAAEKLLMTQSGVSQHIHDLEASLGVHLFVRGHRGVSLTPAGQMLHEYTRRILALVAEAVNEVTNVAELPSGQVSMGATPGVGVYLLPEWMQSFRQQYPKLTVMLQTNITPQIIVDLLAGRLDFGIIEGEIAEPVDRDLGVYVLQEIEQLVVVGRKHPFWQREQLAIEELDGQVFAMRQPTSQTYIWLMQMLEQHGVSPRIGAEFDTVESIKRTVMFGNALTILPWYAVRDEEAFGVLRTVRITGKPLLRTVKLVWDKRRHFTPVTHSLLRHLQGCFPALRGVV